MKKGEVSGAMALFRVNKSSQQSLVSSLNFPLFKVFKFIYYRVFSRALGILNLGDTLFVEALK
jgi:hypothetical protein